jgi:methyl-accepting chemotaxis protein
MAINIPIITEFADAGLKSARGAFDQFKLKVGEAEGGMAKFRAAGGVAMDTVKANALGFAAAAGGAIAGFALKAINDFKDLALGVDEFRNKTNLSLEASSKWVSFTGDLGIASDSMVKVFDRLGRAIEKDGQKPFNELGIEIERTSGGAADLEGTFLKTVDALNKIEDPAKRARLQAELFGKGWQDASEIINMSSEDIRKSLDGINEFEIVDEDEIRKAKELREAQDRLGDALARISVELGEKLIPAFTQAVEAAIPLLDVLGDISDVLLSGADSSRSYSEQISTTNVQMRTGWQIAEKLFGWLDRGKDSTENLTGVTEDMARAWDEGYRSMINARQAADDITTAFYDVDEALRTLKGNVDERQAWRNLIDEMDKAGEAARKAFEEATPEALRASEAALDRTRVKVGEYIAKIDEIPDEQKTEFIAVLDTANLAEIERMLNQAARARQIPFMPVLGPGLGGINEIGSGGRPIGEAPIGFGIGNRSAQGVTVNVAGSIMTEQDLIETVRKGLVTAQRNGAGLVYVNS